ncbi:MAG: DNA repair protein RecN (Recombination protein N) [Rhodospirillaceae bacterium]|nr:MAG: DNA repair protein RecN (Recombination protein N) [Rhodospirillaceae bacterium]
MLVRLSIRDVVLIDRMDVRFAPGLSVLTGETGAGKSILLDSLGLALGARAESALVRQGAGQLTVVAHFDPPPGHPVWAIVAAQNLGSPDEAGAGLVLRRTVTADGRSRAHLNDRPVSVTLLRRIGEELVEVHGQFESHGLLNPATHRPTLDSFAGLDPVVVAETWQEWRGHLRTHTDAEAEFKKDRTEEDLLRHAVEELDSLAPRAGEEAELIEQRAVLMQGEKIVTALNAANAALRQGGGVERALRSAQRHLEKAAAKAKGRLGAALAAIDRAAIETAEALSILEQAAGDTLLDPRHLEQAEERLFALRTAARKHGVTVDDLTGLHQTLRARLAALENSGSAIAELARAEQAARARYRGAAHALSEARKEAARRLDAILRTELGPLKLERAAFRTEVTSLPESEWSAGGCDHVVFTVATNPGTAPGPLHRIASGGELARFMLALKVVLARTSAVCTLVFDEVDAGIGGATAHAVGERLARLAADVQVLVVTHSPQVAARGNHHFKVEKQSLGAETSAFVAREGRAGLVGGVRTVVEALTHNARREEIARMLAGAEITDEARAAADSLMGLKE